MSNVRIKVANKIASIVERRDFYIKQAKAERLLQHLGLDKRASVSTDVSKLVNRLCLRAYGFPNLFTGAGAGTITGAIGLALKDKKDRKLRDYLTYLGGGAFLGGHAGLTYDLMKANSELCSALYGDRLG